MGSDGNHVREDSYDGRDYDDVKEDGDAEDGGGDYGYVRENGHDGGGDGEALPCLLDYEDGYGGRDYDCQRGWSRWSWW